MKRYAVFVMRFALAPMISGTFVVSATGRAAPIEWAHIVAGFTLIYLIVWLVVRAAMHREARPAAALALVLALTEAIPGLPRLHAAISPVLFTVLAWAAASLPWEPGKVLAGKWRVFILPALVLTTILFGVGLRHQTSGLAPHLGFAMLAGGILLGFCVFLSQRHPDDAGLRGLSNLTIAVILFQLAAGATAMVIRMLEIDGGLALGLARTTHIMGAALVLAASTMLAIQYRRRVAARG